MHLTAGKKLFARLSGFIFLAVLVTGMGIEPARIQAQIQAPVSQSTNAAPAAAPVDVPNAKEPAESEQDALNVYRHAPIVQTLAKMFHLPLETTARLFEYINFAILVLAIGIPLFRVLPRILRNRTHTLRENVQSARIMTDEARARLAAVEAKLSRLDEEIAQIRAQAEGEGKHDEARIKASIGEESARIVAAAEQEIAASAAQARRGLRGFAADLAIEQAAKQMVLTPEIDRALIDEFVRDTARRGRN